jgi:hypothetical protein
MEEKPIKNGSQRMIQQNLFGAPDNRPGRSKFISTYRIDLVKGRRVAFEQCQLVNSQRAQPLIRKLIETRHIFQRFCHDSLSQPFRRRFNATVFTNRTTTVMEISA